MQVIEQQELKNIDWETPWGFGKCNLKDKRINLSSSRVASLFPEAKASIKKIIKNDKKTIRDLNNNIKQLQQKIQYKIRNRVEQDCTFTFLSEFLYGYERDQVLNRIKFNEKVLRSIEFKKASEKEVEVKGGVDPHQVEMAKQYPITDLGIIDFNRSGYALCIWHNEETPSMKYSKKFNRVKCFGCQKSGSSIDIIMKEKNCDFVEAVKFLSGGA